MKTADEKTRWIILKFLIKEWEYMPEDYLFLTNRNY